MGASAATVTASGTAASVCWAFSLLSSLSWLSRVDFDPTVRRQHLAFGSGPQKKNCECDCRAAHGYITSAGARTTVRKVGRVGVEPFLQQQFWMRPHSSVGYRLPAPEIVAWPASPAVESARPAIASRPPLN